MFDDDLEEMILKRNIPGKYHRWDKDGDEQGHREDLLNNDDHSDGEDHDHETEFNIDDPLDRQMNSVTTEKLLTDESIPDEIKFSILDERNRKHNTGVKGVLADRKAHKALEKALYEAKQKERNDILLRIAQGAKEQAPSSEFVHTAPFAGDNEDDDLDDDDDEEFMNAFRAKRLAEMKAVTAIPSFGTMREVSNEDLVEELETVDKRVFVVVHLYEPGITSCVRMNRIIDELCRASSMIHTKFLRIACSRNGLEIDRVAFPMLSVYRAGALEQTFAGDADFGGEFFKKEDVEWLLESHFR